jgi:hypothetical protein
VITGASWLSVNTCSAASAYYEASHFLPIEMVIVAVKMFVIFTIGTIIFVLIKNKARSKFSLQYNSFKYIYFAMLPLLAFYYLPVQIIDNIRHREIEQSLCNKSSYTSMTIKSTGVTLLEYKYLQEQLHLFPNLPLTAQNINTDFFCDSFLGDFILQVNFMCDTKEKIDTAHHHWFIDKRQPLTGKKLVKYENGPNKKRTGNHLRPLLLINYFKN